ncbi:MAG: hypothetical protein HOV68_06000 [Streptomycetaceae bacterium]|nr:hypothetical protein [Streptomycetaceae bacterium]
MSPRQKVRALRLFVARHRRPLAALSAALAVAAGIVVARPPTPPSVPVLVAVRDLESGAVPGPHDLRTARLPPGTVPDHALRRPADTHGRALAAGVRRGEPITDVRLVGPQLRGSPGSVALPVRFADADAARLLRPGDRVDVLAGPASDTPGVAGDLAAAHARIVARESTVLARPDGDRDREGGLVILSVAPEAATAIAGAGASAPLTYTMHSAPGDRT